MVFVPYRCDSCAHLDIEAARIVTVKGLSWRGNSGSWVVNLGIDRLDRDLYCFKNCICNMGRALEDRFNKPGREARKRFLERSGTANSVKLWNGARKTGRVLRQKLYGIKVWTDEQVTQSFRGGKRKIYARTFEKIRKGPINEEMWGEVEAFTKTEEYLYYEKIDRIPRPIQPRSMEYRAYMSKFLKPVSVRMKTMKLPGENYPFIAKGGDNAVLAKLFRDKWECFADPVCLCLDLTKFDATIHPELKKLENEFFSAISEDRLFRKGLKLQEKDEITVTFKIPKANPDKTPKKVKMQKGLHGRCSGDPQTSDGNCYIMGIVCHNVFDCRKETYANGDDTNVIMERSDMAKYRSRFIEDFACFGLDVREEGVFDNIYDVEWCQCKYTDTPLGDLWIRKYKRVLNTLTANREFLPHKVKSLMSQVALGELHNNPGVPIIAPVANYIATYYKQKRVYKFVDYRPPDTIMKVRNDKYIEPREKDRQRFNEVYHMTPCEQISLEKEIIAALSKWEPLPVDRVWGGTSKVHPFV